MLEVMGLLFLYPASWYELATGAHVTISWSALAALIYLGIVPTAITYILWNKGIQAVGPAKAGYFYNLLPIYTAILATVFLGESISWYHLAGGLPGPLRGIFGIYPREKCSLIAFRSSPPTRA